MTQPPWFGEAPARWNVRPLYATAKERRVPNRGLREQNLLSLSFGRIVQKDIASSEGLLPASFETYQIVEPQDIVLRMTDLQNDQRSLRSGLVLERGIITSAYLALALRGVNSRFMAYQLRAIDQMKVFYSMGGGLRQSIGYGDLKRLPVLVPPMAEQRAIADFLDRETAQIDAFIAKNEQLISLLTERRAATADVLGEDHVGGGLRLKHHLREVDVRAGSTWADMPLLSVSISWGVRRRDEVTDDPPQALDMASYKVAEAGDIVLNRMRAFQGALGCAPERGLVSPDYAVLRSRGGADPRWLSIVMRTSRFVGEMTSRLKGIGGTESGAVRTPRINVADLNEIRVSVPSPSTQADQTATIQARAAGNDRAAATARRSIELARERRAALISAAVTGKIDVGVSA